MSGRGGVEKNAERGTGRKAKGTKGPQAGGGGRHPTGPRPGGVAGPAEQALTLALVQLLDHGRRTPCGEPGAAEAFLAEDHETRATVTGLCVGCPVFIECDAAAVENRERFGVWAGVDRGLKGSGA